MQRGLPLQLLALLALIPACTSDPCPTDSQTYGSSCVSANGDKDSGAPEEAGMDSGAGDGDGEADGGGSGDGDASGGDGDGELDASSDAQPTLPCTQGSCTDPEKPVCSAGTCVACTSTDLGACEKTPTPYCLVGGNECVACNDNSACKTAERSYCAPDHTCQPCDPASSNDCADSDHGHVCLEATPAGREGNKCVQCTGTSYADCGTAGDGTPYVCDSQQNICTQINEKAAGLCASCLSDAMCKDGMACVPEVVNGQQQPGYVCLEVRAESGPGSICKRPYIQPRDKVTSIDGKAVNVCTLSVTSCLAMNQFRRTITGCEGKDDDDACGLPGLNDGYCEKFNSSFVCTMPCLTSDDCKEGTACNTQANPSFCDLQSGTCYNDDDCKAPGAPNCNTTGTPPTCTP